MFFVTILFSIVIKTITMISLTFHSYVIVTKKNISRCRLSTIICSHIHVIGRWVENRIDLII